MCSYSHILRTTYDTWGWLGTTFDPAETTPKQPQRVGFKQAGGRRGLELGAAAGLRAAHRAHVLRRQRGCRLTAGARRAAARPLVLTSRMLHPRHCVRLAVRLVPSARTLKSRPGSASDGLGARARVAAGARGAAPARAGVRAWVAAWDNVIVWTIVHPGAEPSSRP